jgi:hypothetical protein
MNQWRWKRREGEPGRSLVGTDGSKHNLGLIQLAFIQRQEILDEPRFGIAT